MLKDVTVIAWGEFGRTPRINPGAGRENKRWPVSHMRALAERLHVKLRIEWLDIQHETAVGQLLQHACDLVFGEAVDVNAVADDEELAGKVVVNSRYGMPLPATPIAGPLSCAV